MGMTDIAAIADPQGLRDQWLAQREERRARIAAGIASFGGMDADYTRHVLSCDTCAGPYSEMCVVGRRLYDALMREERRAGER